MKITVITVCLNGVHTIERAIKSVIGQEYRDLEYIVVDGGSTDGTLEILKKYDSDISYWISEPDNGIFDAMNKGIELASGDVIAFLNSDDWYENNALKMIENTFAANDCDCVCCDNYVLEKDGNTTYYDATMQPFDDIYIRMIFYHSAIFCKRNYFMQKENFNPKYRIAADYDWFLRNVKRGLRVYYVHQPVFTFCYGGISSVNDIDCAKEAREIALHHLPIEKKKYIEQINKTFYRVIRNSVLHRELGANSIERRANVLWGAGMRGKQCIKLLQSANIKIYAIIDSNKLKWGESIKGVGICSPEILKQGAYNLIITPDNDKEIEEAVKEIGNYHIEIFKLNALLKIIEDNFQMELV